MRSELRAAHEMDSERSLRQLKLIASAGATEGLRWAREHLYALLVLGPLVLGMTYFGVGRLISEAEWSLQPAQMIALAILTAAGLLVSSLSRASAEVYHTRRPESLFDTLPVMHDVLLCAALVRRAARNSGVAAVAVVARYLVEGGALDITLLAALLLFVAVSSVGELFGAIEWVHWGHRREKAHAVTGFLASGSCAVAGGLLLVLIVRPQALEPATHTWLLAAATLTIVVVTTLMFALHRRWREGDLEYARLLRARDRWGNAAARVARRVAKSDRPVAALVARDLRLTLRGFSSAVYACAGVAALCVLALVAVLETVQLPPGPAAARASWGGATWLPSVLIVKGACVVGCVSLACLVPALVTHQTQHLWLERSSGASAANLARAKLSYARVVTLPAALAVWMAGAFTGASPLFYVVPMLAECLWLWWLISTLAGGLAYEIPEQPGLSLVLVACAGLAAGGFTAFLWPMGLALYAFGLPQLVMRGRHRAHLHLMGREV